MMSYLTFEVEINHGRVVAKGSGTLPDIGSGLLTIIQTEKAQSEGISSLAALEALQKHLNLDLEGSVAWMSTVRDARR